jgi:hypothetical protein
VNQQDAGSAEVVPSASPLPDSSDLPGAAEVRDGPEWRQLSFRASGLTIELEITGSGEYRRRWAS